MITINDNDYNINPLWLQFSVIMIPAVKGCLLDTFYLKLINFLVHTHPHMNNANIQVYLERLLNLYNWWFLPLFIILVVFIRYTEKLHWNTVLVVFKNIRRWDRISKWRESTSQPEVTKVDTWRWAANSSFSGAASHWCLGNILRLSFSSQYVSFIACRRASWLSNVTGYACWQIRAVILALRHVDQSEISIRTWLKHIHAHCTLEKLSGCFLQSFHKLL